MRAHQQHEQIHHEEEARCKRPDRARECVEERTDEQGTSAQQQRDDLERVVPPQDTDGRQ